MVIADVRLRRILDSRAQVTVEADLELSTGATTVTGRGSCPVAIAPGRLEARRGAVAELSDPVPDTVTRRLRGLAAGDQRSLDAALRELDAEQRVGADVTLAVSLAYARASAAAHGVPLVGYLAELAGSTPRLPRLLVNVFSGGIHHAGRPDGPQQIMLVPSTGELRADVTLARAVFAEVERRLSENDVLAPLSASSGLAVSGLSAGQRLTMLAQACEQLGAAEVTSFGMDVAAEHLCQEPGRYRWEGATVGTAEFGVALRALATEHRLSYLEDPFDPADITGWRALRDPDPVPGLTVVGDDLFATDATRVDGELADALLLKLSQAGTVSATLDAAAAARAAGMSLTVSHRSGETEDTGMCDLAAALGAELIKVGGPRRGDRLAKYNQLLRLAETVPGYLFRPALPAQSVRTV